MPEPTLYERCLDAAAILPGTWTVTQDARYPAYCTLARGEDGLELVVHRQGERLTVSPPVVVAGAAVRRYYHDFRPQLRLSARRAGVEIGAAIARRLLDDAAAWWGAAQAWRRRLAAEEDAQRRVLSGAGRLPGARPLPDGWAGDQWRLQIAAGAVTLTLFDVDPVRILDLLARLTTDEAHTAVPSSAAGR